MLEDIKQLKARKTFSNGKKKKETKPVVFGLQNLTVLGAKQCMFLILRHHHWHDVKAEVIKDSRHW